MSQSVLTILLHTQKYVIFLHKNPEGHPLTIVFLDLHGYQYSKHISPCIKCSALLPQT